MSPIDFEKCDCNCHNPQFIIKHIFPCCYECDICLNKIKSAFISEHKMYCGKIDETENKDNS